MSNELRLLLNLFINKDYAIQPPLSYVNSLNGRDSSNGLSCYAILLLIHALKYYTNLTSFSLFNRYLQIHMMTYIFMLATKVVANFVTERMSVTSCITNLKNKKSIKRRRFESWTYKTLIPSTFYIKCLNTRRDLRIWYNAFTWNSAEIIRNLRKDRGMHHFSVSQITFVLDFDFFW